MPVIMGPSPQDALDAVASLRQELEEELATVRLDIKYLDKIIKRHEHKVTPEGRVGVAYDPKKSKRHTHPS